MANLLYIDTAGENAMVAISINDQLLAINYNSQSNTHAAFVQVAIDELLKQTGIQIQAIDGVAVIMGPGSYTGLRVGLSSAKGIAYAINKPLIGISTLALLAKHASAHPAVMQNKQDIQIFCMIDAKRMEVFGAIYKEDDSVVVAPQSIILEAAYLEALLKNGPVLCVGNGATKTKTLLTHPQLYWMEESYDIEDLIYLTKLKWEAQDFEDIAYSAPSYLKDFYQIPSTKA